MSVETGQPRFYGQSFEGVAVPERGGEVGEEARLHLAPVGVYEVHLRQQPKYEFGGELLCNGATPQLSGDEGERQFEVSEDVAGIERTLMIQVNGDEAPFESLEVTPLDWDERPIQFTRMGEDARHSTIRYRKNAPPESLKIRFSGISVFEVESIIGCLWVRGRSYTLDPLPAVITRGDEIRVDLLRNPNGGARRLEEHLRALFGALAEDAPGRACTVRWDYQYLPSPGGLPVIIPVLMKTSLSLSGDDALFSEIPAPLIDWYQTSAPAKGVFNFGVEVYGTRSPEPAPVLRHTQLLLPPELISELG